MFTSVSCCSQKRSLWLQSYRLYFYNWRTVYLLCPKIFEHVQKILDVLKNFGGVQINFGCVQKFGTYRFFEILSFSSNFTPHPNFLDPTKLFWWYSKIFDCIQKFWTEQMDWTWELESMYWNLAFSAMYIHIGHFIGALLSKKPPNQHPLLIISLCMYILTQHFIGVLLSK